MLISGVTPINKKATRSEPQTLMCYIDSIREEPRFFRWYDPEGKIITADTEGYSIKGSMTAKISIENGVLSDDLSGYQETTLTISPSLLQKHGPNSVVKYGCSASSSPYQESEPSDIILDDIKRHDVIVTFLTMSECNFVMRIKNVRK